MTPLNDPQTDQLKAILEAARMDDAAGVLSEYNMVHTFGDTAPSVEEDRAWHDSDARAKRFGGTAYMLDNDDPMEPSLPVIIITRDWKRWLEDANTLLQLKRAGKSQSFLECLSRAGNFHDLRDPLDENNSRMLDEIRLMTSTRRVEPMEF